MPPTALTYHPVPASRLTTGGEGWLIAGMAKITPPS